MGEGERRIDYMASTAHLAGTAWRRNNFLGGMAEPAAQAAEP